MDKNISIEQYTEEDEFKINDLFNSVFNYEKRDITEWSWKFKEAPIDSRPIIVLAKDGDRVVGQYPCIAYYLKYQDKVVKVAQVVDIMVREGYRGGAKKGLLARMIMEEEALLRGYGIALVFGFPTDEHYLVDKRLVKQYIDLIKIENLFKCLSWKVALRQRANIPFLINFAGGVSRLIIRFLVSLKAKPIKAIRYRWIDSVDERVDAFWKRVREQYPIIVERDFRYLNWRYCNKPDNDYHILQAERDGHIVGIIVVKYEDRWDTRIGFIMECLAFREAHLMENLVQRGLIFLSRKKVDYVLVRLSSGDPVKDIFHKTGFILKEGIWLSNVVYNRYSPDIEDSVLQDPSMWHISFGDCDAL